MLTLVQSFAFLGDSIELSKD